MSTEGQQYLIRDEIIEQLRKIPAKSIRGLFSKITLGNNYIQLKESIIETTKYLSDNCKFTERLYHLAHNLDSPPLCKSCKCNYTKFEYFDKGYRSFCSNECSKSYVKRRDLSITNYLSREEILEQLKRVSIDSINELVPKITLGNNYIQLKESIIETTKYLSDNCKFTERLYHILNGLTSRPLCKNCQQNYTKFKHFNRGYLNFCSNECSTEYLKERDESITNHLSREEIIEEFQKIPAQTILELIPKITLRNSKILLKESIIEATNYLPNDCKFTERLYHILNGLTSRPVCPKCQRNYLNFENFTKGYFQNCSSTCAVLIKKQVEPYIARMFLREEIIEQLRKIPVKSAKDLALKITRNFDYFHLKESIIGVTNYLPEDCRFTERLYHLAHNIESRPLCKNCKNNYVNFKHFKGGYNLFCSDKCSKSYVKRRDLSITNYLSREEILEQLKKFSTNNIDGLIRSINFAVEHKLLKESIIEATNYLPIDCRFSERIYQLINNLTSRPLCKTCKQNYITFKDFHNGYHRFCSETCSRNDPEVKEKTIQTWKENWGEDHPLKSKAVRKKISQARFSNDYKYMSSPERIGEGYKLVTPLEEYEGVTRKYLNFKHKKCGHIFEYIIQDGRKPHCPKCYANMSRFEEEVRQFCEQHFDNLIYNSKQIIPPLEIDIYIPDINIAIECNGVYWHSDQFKNKDYHHQKYLNCAKQNVWLLQIFEDEWKDKRELVKSYLLNTFVKSPNTIQSSQCEIYEIPQEFTDRFLNHNHLEGSIKGTHYGLVYNNNLVSLISVGPILNNSKYNLGIYRFCDARDTKVVGGLSKLVDHVKQNHQSTNLAAYIDLRYSSVAKDLVEAGFKYVQLTDPTFSYVKGQKRYPPPKSVEEAQLLVESYDPDKSIEENMINNNFFKIFDSGYAIFENT